MRMTADRADEGVEGVDRRVVIAAAAGLAAPTPLLAASASQAAETGAAPAANGAIHQPARIIPPPRTVSPEAQKSLADGAARLNAGAIAPPSPPITDKAAWRARIAAADKMFDPMIDALLASPAKVERTMLGGVNVCIGTPNEMRHPDRARLTLHGGAWTLLGGRYVMGDAAQGAAEGGCTTFAVDYRMPPDFPYPAAVDDCVAAYREVIKRFDPKKVAISGASAGGNLTGAVTLKIRDLGLPLPGAIGMLTPVTDLTGASDTLKTNLGVDTVLTAPLDNTYALYADGHDLTDPYISPVYGDFSRGFPPTFLQSGTRDLLLSDTVRMHAKLVQAGVTAELHVWEAMPHGGFGGFSPEDKEIRHTFLKFVDRHLG
jgi:acetyl esterase/lipase